MPRSRKRAVSRSSAPSAPFFRLSREFVQRTLDFLEIGVAQLDTDGLILYANNRFIELLDIQPFRRSSSTRLKNLISAASWRVFDEALQKAQLTRQEGEIQIDSPSGTRNVRLILDPVQDAESHIISATAIDTTDLVAANSAVRDRESALQALTGRILQVQDQERRRIARDLHDVTGQELVGISLALTGLVRTAKTPGASLQKDIDDCMHYVRKVEDDIRTLSYVLHPPLLDELGLASALHWYVEGFKKRAGLTVVLDIPENTPRLPIERETALFRVVQEGLTNVIRHSRSSKALLRVRVEDHSFVLSVEDDGAGIEPRKLEAANTTASRAEFGVGIRGMRERLKQLGGSLELRSSESGTELIARVPLADHQLATSYQPIKETETPHHEFHRRASNGRKRILIADDHEVARRGIRDIIANQPDLEVCGEAQDGFEAIVKTRELEPDLLILDLSMPKVAGFTAAQRLREAGNPTKILVFSNHAYAALGRLIESAGCQGYVEKSNAGEDLLKGIRAVLNGQRFYNSEALPAKEPPNEPPAAPPPLKKRPALAPPPPNNQS
jgi:signal transduction histidine kinase/DNA-binding NarL/FixJ family response regulator